MSDQSRTLAVLGPTNTGKTHYAIERMLGYRTGIIGLPLRLLAREVYDKIVAVRGPSVVALVTGEERIVPERTQYWVCTVEAMPEGMGADFVAVDEIQLCADPERGHVFTDRLLRMRGLRETQFLGSHTMRPTIAALVPGVEFLSRERMSQLSYSGPKKIARMPARSAIVGFSVENVYAIAELLRRQKGGAAVVMGALSPRTRNAQVDLYQNGDVDYLVATDAIGMGLNLDIDHVAFSSLTKFDGRRMRQLQPNELGQIAGRAGRGMSHGTFGVTGEAPDLDPELAQAITEHRFAPVRKLEWRNARLAYGSTAALIASLEARPEHELLARAREADDLGALKALAELPDVARRASDAQAVRLLWDVCRIPDFRGISAAEHAGLLERIFCDLVEFGRVPDDWLAGQVRRIDRTDGDIDTLSKRLAYIRTWTYVAQRKGWVDDENHWRGATRAVEDRLSDALHGALTQRFVDRRTSVLLRRLKQKEAMVAEVNETGDVTVEGEFVGRLAGFRFVQDRTAAGNEARTLQQASLQALAPHFHLKADRFYNAPDTEIDFTEQGGLLWGKEAVGKLTAGADALKPQVVAFVDDEAGADVAAKVQRRLQHFIDRKIATLFEPLLNIQRDETLSGLARGFGFRMVEGYGILPRGEVAGEVKALDQEARGALRKHGIRFGQFTVFLPLLLKPAPTRLRLVLWSLSNGLDEFPEAPPPGLVTVPAHDHAPKGYFTMAGYRAAGERAIRIDMLERLADMLRGEDTRGGFEAKADMLSITGMTLEQFAGLMQGLGYKAERGEREKVKPVDQAIAEAPADAAEVTETTVGDAAAEIADTGEAAFLAEPAAQAEVPAGIAETPEEELPPGETPEVAAPEVEVFYTFAWAPRAHRPRGERPAQGARGAPNAAGDRGKQGRPGKPKGKPGKGKPREGREEQGAKSFSARPEKKDRIDPDNPFAAALMGLRTKG
ncbi:ATP-dependent RNA helicase SUPV3L1/SUV3 [Roseovarius azorensis]|uniref:ATP-dependent RNA helicase SUPV3L1/SUV3 n=1 Tax=Roseovarius azorensis TaxID=1287727 RepID=A0A1H7MHK3_9RHOB|nr:helicase-related protein [Roseovarius azorensis]SEL10571.1 ATP-dependent RNA helicase SUPV3L1/SUV3 [Roseovarius azorensis]